VVKAPQRQGGGPAARAARRYTPMTAVVVAAFGAFLAFLDSTVVNVAFPNIQASFPHARIGELSWILNSYNVVFAGLLVLFGRLADLLGRRRVFRLGLLVFVVMSGLCTLATSVPMLIGFRLVQGVGAAMLVPASLGIVVHAADQEHRSHALSLWIAGAAVAAGLGPPVGGALVVAYDWRLVFLINVPLGLVAWWLAGRRTLESRAPGVRVLPDLRGALSLSAGLGALTLGIVQGGSWGWGSGLTVGSFALAVVAFGATVLSSRRHPEPILDPRVLALPDFALGNLVTLAAGLGLYTYLLTHILWLHYVWGYSLLLAGLAITPGAVVTAAAATPFGRLADRFGVRVVLVPGALLWAGAYLWYVTEVGVHPDFLGQWLPGQVLSGLGAAATLPISSSGTLAAVPAARYGVGSAFNSSARQVGGVVGIAVLSVLVAHPSATGLPGELRHGWELAGWSFFGAAVLGVGLGRIRSRAEAPDQTPVPLRLVAAPPQVETSPVGDTRNLLDEVPAGARQRLLAAAGTLTLHAGEVLFEAGESGDALYLVEVGRLTVLLPDGSSTEIHPGMTVGELAVLTDAPRSATVTARRDTVLRVLTRDALDAILPEEPGVGVALARAIARRLHASRPAPAPCPAPRVVGLVGLDDTVSLEPVADALVAALDRYGRVVRLGRHDPGELQAAEAAARWVVVTGGPREPDLDRVMRQADRVVLVAGSAGPPARRFVPAGQPTAQPGAGSSAPQPPCDLVLIGPVPPSAVVGAWQEATGCRRVLHVGPGRLEASSMASVVNRLTGRSLGVILSGGGARALAHLGLLHALEEAGVVVDRVAGSSVGSLIAAAYATGADAAAVDELVFDELVAGQPFRDWRLPTHSLASGERLRGDADPLLRRCPPGVDRPRARGGQHRPALGSGSPPPQRLDRRGRRGVDGAAGAVAPSRGRRSAPRRRFLRRVLSPGGLPGRVGGAAARRAHRRRTGRDRWGGAVDHRDPPRRGRSRW
jgi:NTE family protein